MKVQVSYIVDSTGMGEDQTVELELFTEKTTLYCCHDKRLQLEDRFYREVRNALIEYLGLSEWEVYELHIWKIYAI